MRPAHFLLAGFIIFMIATTVVANLGYGPDFLGILDAIPMGLGDKFGHAVLFGMLALLANLATRLRHSWFVTGLVALAATADEISQRFLANRSFDLLDLLASLIGIVAAGAIAAAIAQRSDSLYKAEARN